MARKPGVKYIIDEKKAATYDTIMPLLTSMYSEFQELSKKKPEATLSAKKVEIANRILKEVLELLEGEPSRQYLELLDDASLPQNSDVVLILGQAVTAMRGFHNAHSDFISGTGDNHWLFKDK